MSRLRERDTAPEGEDAGAQPNRDSSLTLEGLSRRGDGRRNGRKRRSGRQRGWLLPQVKGQDPRGDGSSRGDRPLGGALNKHRWRYGSTAGARPWRRRKRPASVRLTWQVPRRCRCPREGTEEQTPWGQSRRATSPRDLAVGESPCRAKPQGRYQPEIWLDVRVRSNPSRGWKTLWAERTRWGKPGMSGLTRAYASEGRKTPWELLARNSPAERMANQWAGRVVPWRGRNHMRGAGRLRPNSKFAGGKPESALYLIKRNSKHEPGSLNQ